MYIMKILSSLFGDSKCYVNQPYSQLEVHPVLLWQAVVIHHLPAIPVELVVQELVGQVKLDTKKEEVEQFTYFVISSYVICYEEEQNLQTTKEAKYQEL